MLFYYFFQIFRCAVDCVQAGKAEAIRKIITVLTTEFCNSSKSDCRKGGVLGLSALAIGMQKVIDWRNFLMLTSFTYHASIFLPFFFISQDAKEFAETLTRPILGCCSDPDIRVRYYAVESLYNVAKTCRSSILFMLNEIFIATSEVIADKDHSVRNSAELLDRLMKDIITETKNFQVGYFNKYLCCFKKFIIR